MPRLFDPTMPAKTVKHVNIYVTPEVHEVMRRSAESNGVSLARWCRDAVRLKLKREAERAQGQAS